MKYFHISYIAGVPLLYDIINRLNAVQPAARRRLGRWTSQVGDAAIALSTKIRILQIAVQRLEQDITKLNDEVSDRAEEVDRCARGIPPRALVLRNDILAFRLAASIDGFLYEARSTYEMLRSFVVIFTRHILRQSSNADKAEKVIEKAMRDAGHNPDWIKALRRYRTFFFHEAAPWIALEIVKEAPRRYELLILHENVADLEQHPSYTKLEEYRGIWMGLRQCALDVQTWAVSSLQNMERSAGDP